MDFFAWLFGVLFFAMYIFCLFTVCFLTFQKGHIVLGIIGIFLPFLWLIGAIIPAKRGSHWDVQQQLRMQAQQPSPAMPGSEPSAPAGQQASG